MPTISVISPCLNEEKYLGLLLDDLVVQASQPDEVIVADCASKDKTIAVAESYKSKLPIKIVHSRTRSAAAARNEGAEASSGEYLLFIDADMRIPKNTVSRMKKSLASHPVDYLTPAYKSDGMSFADRVSVWFVMRMMNLNMKLLHRAFGIGGVMCVKSSKHKEVDGFNESLNTYDDMDYIQRLRRARTDFTYLHDLTTVTSSRRFEGHSWPVALLILLGENSKPAQWTLQPLLKKIGKHRKYGHYE